MNPSPPHSAGPLLLTARVRARLSAAARARELRAIAVVVMFARGLLSSGRAVALLDTAARAGCWLPACPPLGEAWRRPL